MFPPGLQEQGKRQSRHSSGLDLLVTSLLAEHICCSWHCQVKHGVARCEALQMFCVVEPTWSDTNLAVMLPLLHPWSEQGGWYCGNCAGQNWSVLAGNGQMSGDWVEKYVNVLNELVLWCWRSRMQPVGLRSENCYLVSSFVSSWYSEPIHLLKVGGKCFGCGHEKWMRWKGTRETKAFSSFYRE